MQRPDTDDGLFHPGNPATGQKGTPITADWLNALLTVSVFYHGNTEPPPADLGDDGDYYQCLTTRNFYGPKTSGAWGDAWAQGIPGPPGVQGPAGSAEAAFWADVLVYDISTDLTGYDVMYLANTGAALAWVLPTAVAKKGRVIYLENIGSSGHQLSITPLEGETIEGQASLELDDGMGIKLYSDGANWRVYKG